MRISDWSSDVCSSDLYWKGDALPSARHAAFEPLRIPIFRRFWFSSMASNFGGLIQTVAAAWMMTALTGNAEMVALVQTSATLPMMLISLRSEEHTSELQSLMRISYAVFCLKKKTKNKTE